MNRIRFSHLAVKTSLVAALLLPNLIPAASAQDSSSSSSCQSGNNNNATGQPVPAANSVSSAKPRPIINQSEPAATNTSTATSNHQADAQETTKNDRSGSGSTQVQVNRTRHQPVSLQGSVQGTAVPFNEGIARIGLAGQMIQTSCLDIMKESTRKDTIVMRGPNALPNGVVIPALGGQGGVMQFGELPIRKDRLKRYIVTSTQNLVALQSYVDGLIVPTNADSAQSYYDDLRANLQSAQDHLAKLTELSGQRHLSNKQIGKEALSIHDAISLVEKDCSLLAKAVTPPEIGTADK